MYDIIKRYVDNENKNGLMLIDMPTGSGKTYSAIKYIFDACMDPQNKDRKYIFVTTLKKNLPYDDLQKWFNSIGKSELYQEKVLVIDSNMDSVVDGWSPEVESAIPAEIKKSDEYKNFQRDLSFVKRQREEKNSCDAGISGQYRIQFAGKNRTKVPTTCFGLSGKGICDGRAETICR